jgi:hypothetical protein
MRRKKDTTPIIEMLKSMGFDIDRRRLNNTTESSSVGKDVYEFLMLKSALLDEGPAARRKRLFVIPGGRNVSSK